MPLTLVLGPANSAKAGEVLGAFAAHSRREAVLVVPTLPDVEHYRAELAANGVIQGLILTPGGLAREIARRAGREARVVSEPVRRAVLARALARIEWEALGESASGRGFAAAALSLISELERALVTPQRFAAALRQWAGEDPGRAAYARDLGRIATGYARELDRLGVEDAELFAWRALDRLRGDPARWGRTPTFFYGFDDLSRTERDAVETLSHRVGAEVTVSLNYEAGREALQARAEVVEELRAIADTVRELPPRDDHYAPAARAPLHHLERWLFSGAGEPVDPGEAVGLLEAGGELAQAELVAAEVRRLLAAGCPPGEIAVVCRSLAGGGPALRSAFAAYGLRLEEERRLPLGHVPLGRAVRGLARLAFSAAAEAGDLLALLRHPGRADQAAVDRLEAEIRRRAIRTAPAAIARWPEPLPEVDALRDAPDPSAELIRQTAGLLAAGREGSAAILDGPEALDAQAVRVLGRELTLAREVLGGIDGDALLALLADLTVLVPSSGPGGVLLAEPLAIRARRFRAVIVCGLNEGEFPTAGGSDPFLPDALRRELAESSGLRLALREDGLARERYLLYACLSRAGERVVLAYRSSDEEGNLALPSPFLAEIAELFVPEWRSRPRRRLLGDVVWDPAQAPSQRERARGIAAGSPATAAAGPGLRQLDAAALGRVRHTQVVSAGALERYGRCPVRWLVESQLAPAALEPQAEPMVRGNFMHRVLDRVFAGLDRPLGPSTLPGALERLRTAIAAELDGAPGAGLDPSVRTALVFGLEADLRRYLEQEAADGCTYIPRHTELRFGIAEAEGELPPLRLGSGEGAVQVRGVIDRIDVDPAGAGQAIVRDYKSGARRAEQAVARWEADGNLQVGLYMLAVQRLLGLEPVAGFYQPLRGGDLRPRGVFRAGEAVGERAVDRDARSAEELDAALESAERRALEIVAAIRSGELEPCPATCGREGCAYPGICRP